MKPSDRTKDRNLDMIYTGLHVIGEIEESFVRFITASGLSVKMYSEYNDTAKETTSILQRVIIDIQNIRHNFTLLLTLWFTNNNPKISWASKSRIAKSENFIPNENFSMFSGDYAEYKDKTQYPGFESQSSQWRKLSKDKIDYITDPTNIMSSNTSIANPENMWQEFDMIMYYINYLIKIDKDFSVERIPKSLDKQSIKNEIVKFSSALDFLIYDMKKMKNILSTLETTLCNPLTE